MTESPQRINTLDAQLLDRMHALRFGNDVILFDRHAFRYYENRLLRFSYAFITFVDAGTADVTIEDRPYHVVANDLFIFFPEQAVSLEHLSEDFHVRCVLLSHDFVSFITTDDSLRFIRMIRSTPLIHMDAHMSSAFCNCYDMLRVTILQHDNPYRKKMLYHTIKTYIYGTMYYVQPELPQPDSREAELANVFMELVDQHFREHHSLAFYADVMHLSGKYISRCVRLSTGQNAVQTIAARILKQAKILLLARQKSIAQIGYELGFPDQSAFGKFFRSHEGISPLRWRTNH